MTFLMAVTAAFALLLAPTHANAVPDIRLIRSLDGAPMPRYVRLVYAVLTDGIRGRETLLVDTRTGRFLDRIVQGPISGATGYDGAQTWTADATGMAELEDHAEDRSGSLAWSYLVARPPAIAPHVERLSSSRRGIVLRLRYPTLTRSFDVQFERATGRVTQAVFRLGGDVSRIVVHGYARHGALIVPASVRTESSVGPSSAQLRSVSLPGAVEPNAFRIPPPPDDASLEGVTTIALERHWYGYAVRASIGESAPMRFLLDTGAALALSPQAARRARLRTVGNGKIGGVGSGVVAETYTVVPRLRIGAAELRDQPADVFPVAIGAPHDQPDGTIGYELFARFAARLDFAQRTLMLARDPQALAPRGHRLRIALEGTTPEVDGALDAVRGRLTIDTGSMAAVDVTSPTVRAHHLLEHYGAYELQRGGGIGGPVYSYAARVRRLRLGDLVVRDVAADLDVMQKGAFADPTIIGNVGLPVLERFRIVLDVRGRALFLERV